jgi:BirA family biotin operon repressor/biotin-[acetyl-CoA-carboxylase] ligase
VISLDTSWVKGINYFRELPSTQELALKLAKEGAEEGTLVVSESQSRGRGRRGNSWFSPKGGLWFSFILRPAVPVSRLAALNLGMGLAALRGIKKLADADVSVRWPNDIQCAGRKLGGIIADAGPCPGRAACAVIGIGINTNIAMKDFPAGLRESAVSLQELGYTVDNLELLGRVLEEAGTVYRVFCAKGFAAIAGEVKKSCSTIGRKVRVAGPGAGQPAEGEALDITGNGGLLLKTVSGETKEIISGCLEII